MATTENFKDKFSAMVNNYICGNLADFRHQLKRLDRAQLLAFCVYCYNFKEEDLDIFEIQYQYNA